MFVIHAIHYNTQNFKCKRQPIDGLLNETSFGFRMMINIWALFSESVLNSVCTK